MTPLSSSVKEFTQAVADGKSIVFDKNGNWSERNSIHAFFRKIFCLEESDIISSAKNYGKYLHTFTLSSGKPRSGFKNSASNEDIHDATQAIYRRLNSCQENRAKKRAALCEKKDMLKLERILNPEQLTRINSQRNDIKKEIFTLDQFDPAKTVKTYIQRAEIASLYNEKSQKTLHSQQYRQDDVDWIEKKVTKWKKTQKSLPDKSLSNLEKESIKKIAHYPEFMRAIRDDHVLRASLFNFVFKNLSEATDDAVDIFVQAPKIQKRLTKSFLDIRIRAIGNQGLRLIEENGQKDVQLLIEKKFMSLKNLDVPIESAGEVETIRSVFRKFKNLNVTTPDWEYMKDGLVYTNTPYPNVDLSKDVWYEDLRDFKIYTKEEVEARIKEPIDWKNTKTFLFVKASRTQEDKHPAGNHAWLEILIPQVDGTFKAHSFGTFPAFFPTGETYFGALPKIFPDFKKTLNTLSEFIFTFGTHEAIIMSPDQNEYNYAREKVEIPISLTEEQYTYTMQELKKDLTEIRNKNTAFQSQGSNNCAGWVQSVLDRLYDKFGSIKAPRVYEVYRSELTLPDPMKILIPDPKKGFWLNLIAKVGSSVLLFFLGGAKIVLVEKEGKKKIICLLTNDMYGDGLIHLPAQLFETVKTVQMLDLTATMVPDLDIRKPVTLLAFPSLGL